MIFAVLMAAVFVAFPRSGAKLPSVECCYMIGATEKGVKSIEIQGKKVPVHSSGGWVTMVDVKEGENSIDVAGKKHCFTVAAKSDGATAKTKQAKVKDGAKVKQKPKYVKLPYASDIAKEPPTNKAPRDITIVLDPGHGDTDAGAITPRGFTEKEANMLMAESVMSELSQMGYHVVMTRYGDTFPALYDRPKIAHANYADAFVSIHHNAPPINKDPRKFRYTCVYAWNEIGVELATAINRRMAAALAGDVKNNGVMSANYAVTRNPEIPSCLIEVDFITTPEGEQACWDSNRRRRVAESIAAGIADWCREPKKRER